MGTWEDTVGIREEGEKKNTQIRAAAQGPAPVQIAFSLHPPHIFLNPKANPHLFFSTGPK